MRSEQEIMGRIDFLTKAIELIDDEDSIGIVLNIDKDVLIGQKKILIWVLNHETSLRVARKEVKKAYPKSNALEKLDSIRRGVARRGRPPKFKNEVKMVPRFHERKRDDITINPEPAMVDTYPSPKKLSNREKFYLSMLNKKWYSSLELATVMHKTQQAVLYMMHKLYNKGLLDSRTEKVNGRLGKVYKAKGGVS